jgi:RimJ/RimL family protein N-acetyltransferase
MIQSLAIDQFPKARPLVRRLTDNHPMCTAVLEGVYPGKVYVDDLTQPRAALLTTYIESETHGTWCYLAGEPAPAFNQALHTAVFSHQIVTAGTPILLFTCDPDDWGGQIDEVFAPRPPIWLPRHHFIGRQIGFDWRAALPPDFAVEPMDDALHHIPGLELPEDVATTLAKWGTFTDPGFVDFGFVILDRTRPQPVIAGWATVDFIAARAGDLGFFTQPDYRRRGLGTVAASAALEHGFATGLQQVNWTCDADNPGSIRTAERLGLERLEDYHMALLIMDEERHMAFLRQASGEGS